MKSALLFSFTLFLMLAGVDMPVRLGAQGVLPRTRQEVVCTLCPTITVSCPDTLSRPGLPVTFTAKVMGADTPPSLTFNWTTSAGEITSGQSGVITTSSSTKEIVVDTTGVSGSSTITVTIEVSGLDRSCSKEASCTTSVLRTFDPESLDTYGNIPFADEQARLDNYAIELLNDPAMNGYIVCYGGRKARRGEASARCERAKRYLVGRRGLEPNRIILIDGGYMEDLTIVLWLLPPNMLPSASPTVDASEVQFIEETQKQKRRTTRKRRPSGQ